VGIAALAAGVLVILFFRAASMIDPRRPNDYDPMIVCLASYSFLAIPCAAVVLFGLGMAIADAVEPFLRKPWAEDFAGTCGEKAEPSRGRLLDPSGPVKGKGRIIPDCPKNGGSSANTFSPKP
jgi:hypothetical protein